MRSSKRRELHACLADSERMLAVLRRRLPELTRASIRVIRCKGTPSKSRDSFRAGRLDFVYRVAIETEGESRLYVLLGVAPVKPGFLAQLDEQRVALRGHPMLAPFREPATYVEELELALLLYPLDPALPALAEITGGSSARALATFLPECRAGARIECIDSELVRYKAFNRAVLKLRVSLRDRQGIERARTVYAKLFADDTGAGCFRGLTALSAATRDASSLHVPEPLGYDDARRMLVMGEAPGRSDLTDWIRRLKKEGTLPADVGLERLQACARLLARALCELQRSGIRPETRRTFRYELRRMKRDRELLLGEFCRSEPDLVALTDALIERLEALVPARERLVPAHGDFEYHQVIGDDLSMTFIDWDGISLANPAFDASVFLGRLLREPRRRPGCAPELEQLGATFRDAFLDGRPELARDLDLYEGLVVTQQVLRSFRHPDRNEEKTLEIRNLASAATALLERLGPSRPRSEQRPSGGRITERKSPARPSNSRVRLR